MATEPSRSESAGPYSGIRVLDLSTAVSGAFAAMLMGDLGAEVIKIEPPGGDQARQWGPFIGDEGKLFLAWNRNKKSIALDLNSARGMEVLKRLVSGADVLIQNYRPGVAERMGIDYESLSRERPELIYAAISGFGTKGPERERPGYDPIFQAMSGAAEANLRYTGSMGICSVAFVDYGTAVLLLGAIGAALYRREREGRGQQIETSLLQTSLAMQSHFFVQGINRPFVGDPGLYPNRMFKTGDGLLQVTAPTNKFWKSFCETIGASELLENSEYATTRRRCDHQDELNEIIEAHLATKPAREWEAMLVESGVPCSAVRTHEEFFDSQQVDAMGMKARVDHPVLGGLSMFGVPWSFSDTPGEIQSAPPLLGEHTCDILRKAGYSEAEITELSESKVVGGVSSQRS